MTETETETNTEPNTFDRRAFLRRSAGVTTAAVGLGAGAHHMGYGPVGRAEAIIVPLVPIGLGVGWILYDDYTADGADSPSSGLTADALKQAIEESTTTRNSNNKSTFVDNENLIEASKEPAYTDAKIAAIEALNNGESQADVESAFSDTADSYYSTLKSNLLKSWNETMAELDNNLTTAEDHPDWDPYNINNDARFTYCTFDNSSSFMPSSIAFPKNSYTLYDGTSLDVITFEGHTDSDSTDDPLIYNPIETIEDVGNANTPEWDFDGDQSTTIKTGEKDGWQSLVTKMDEMHQSVLDNGLLWVDTVYAQVQSGEIDLTDLQTPRDTAETLSDEEGESLAIAELAALNLEIDPEREAEVTIDRTGATYYGVIGLTDDTDGPIESGTKYDPATDFTGDVYLTADISRLEGEWTDYQTGVDGGVITFTAEPYEGAEYDVSTISGEVVTIDASQFNDQGDGTWTYDATGRLDDTITEIESVQYYSASDETDFKTMLLDEPFTVGTIENPTTGESADQLTFTSTEPHDDSNYITQEEWDQFREENQQLIEDYEESQNIDDGSGDLSAGAFTDGAENFLSSTIFGVPVIGWLIGVTGIGIYLDR